MGYYQKHQDHAKLSGIATPRSQTGIDELSQANTDKGRNALIEQIIGVMKQSKGPQFPPRGISELSRQSKTSKSGFTHILKQPQPMVAQPISGDSHTTLQSNNHLKK